MSSFQKRRKPVHFYSAQRAKKRREFVLKPGLKGFLCTCNNREKDCIRESYNILNEYADILYGEDKTAVAASADLEVTTPEGEGKTQDSGSGKEDEEEDIESALNKELETLRAERTKRPDMRRFQVLESGANNCIFIQTMVEDPVQLVHYIMKDLESTKKQKTRFLLRLLPIEITCKAYLEDIRKAADTLFDKYFTKEGKTFAVMFTRRNSSGVDREELIHDLAEMVLRRHPDNKADLKHPQLAILVEVIRNVCCLSVLPDYFQLRKYNLLELCAAEGGIKISNTKDNKTVDQKGDGADKIKSDMDNNVTCEVEKPKEDSAHHSYEDIVDIKKDSKDDISEDKEIKKIDTEKTS